MVKPLPPVIPSKWNSDDILLDKLCDQFEDQLSELKTPNIHAFLQRATPSIRSTLFRELLFLLLQAQEFQGKLPPIRDVLADYPEFESAVFEVYRQLRSNNETIINEIIRTDTDVPSDATIGEATTPPINVSEVVQIGKYSVLRHIDSGGQGDVFLARHPTLENNVVIKLSRREVALQSTSRDRLVEEGQLLAKLNHLGLVRVIDLNFHEQRPFLVMDHLQGPSLREYSGNVPLDAATSVQWVIDLCCAVQEAHNNSIIHRDIKPSNVVIVNGIPTLIDFGLAITTNEDDSYQEVGVAGTVSYMSPEQTYSNATKLGPATDVFGLAAVLYFLLENESPLRAANKGISITLQDARRFDGSMITQQIAHHRCRDVIVKALSNNPAHRYHTASAFAEALATTQPQLSFRKAISTRVRMLFYASCLAIITWVLIYTNQTHSNPIPVGSLSKVDYEVEFSLREDLSSYLYDWDGVRLINEEELGHAKYWMPNEVNKWGYVTYKFPIPFEIGEAKMRAAITIFPAWRNDERFDDNAVALLDVSSDGETWHQVAEVSKETMQVGLPTKLIDISRYVAGGSSVFVRARLLATKEWPNVGPIFAQFMRSPLTSQHDGHRNWEAFNLQITQCGE